MSNKHIIIENTTTRLQQQTQLQFWNGEKIIVMYMLSSKTKNNNNNITSNKHNFGMMKKSL